MTNEEFQKLVLEKLAGLEQGQKTLEQGQQSLEQGQKEILSEIQNLKQADQALLDISEKTYRETEKISQIQTTQGESINILALRQLQTESELSVWKKAK